MLHLEAVEALAIDTDDGALRNEGRGVDVVDDLEDATALAPLGQHKEHFHVLAAVEAVSVDGGDASARLFVDALANLLVVLGNDEELHRTTHAVHHLVDAESRDVEHHVAVDDALPVAQDEVGAGNDDDVEQHDDTPERDVAILVDDGGDDVGAARGSV